MIPVHSSTSQLINSHMSKHVRKRGQKIWADTRAILEATWPHLTTVNTQSRLTFKELDQAVQANGTEASVSMSISLIDRLLINFLKSMIIYYLLGVKIIKHPRNYMFSTKSVTWL